MQLEKQAISISESSTMTSRKSNGKKMDTSDAHEKGRASRRAGSSRREKDSQSKDKKSRAFKEPNTCEKSKTCGDIGQDAQEMKKKFHRFLAEELILFSDFIRCELINPKFSPEDFINILYCKAYSLNDYCLKFQNFLPTYIGILENDRNYKLHESKQE